MPDERWSTTQVTALAPDAGSLAGARALAGRWESSGALGRVLWGLCQGRGSRPYQVCADLSGPAYRCSCPSRKFPCKHALALMLLWAEGGLGRAEAPPFVGEWVSGRTQRAARPARSGAPADPAAARRRAEQRGARVAAGLAELGRWLDDQVQQGLAGAEQGGYQPFEAMAARLVDAQAPGAAGAVRRMGGIAGIGRHWADRLLGEMGLLRLLICGHERLDALPGPLAATVRARIGFPVAQEDVLAGPRVPDRWQALGQVEIDDGALVTRRTWLRGVHTGRFALLLAFAAPGQTPDQEVVPGTEVDAELCFYPGALPLRALIAARDGNAVPVTAPAGAVAPRAALAGWSAALAAEPWRHDMPVLLADVAPAPDGFLVHRAGEALPLAPGHRQPWWLLAFAGGSPATVAAEWSAAGLRPLAAWAGGRYAVAAPPAPGGGSGGGERMPELPPDLLATALVGTARRPWASSSVRVGDRAVVAAGTPSSPGAVEEVASGGSAGALLEAAGVALAYRRAGATPATGHEPVTVSPAETTPPVPAAAGARLLRITGDGGAPGGTHATQEILAQWLALAGRHGAHLPPTALPALLDAGRRNAALRPALAAAAGARGAWLAGMRADWRWLLDEAPGALGDPATWDTGTAGERLAYLRHLRGHDPAAARALVEATWAGEAPEYRARFVTALGTGLSLADDPFLDRALDDRRKEVREAAGDLLRRLSGSALSHRMRERARAAVRLERRSFGRDRLLVEPPAELDAALRRDGVGAGPPRGAGIGAWLLEEVVAGTPLDTWTTDLARTPTAVVELAHGHDWQVPLLHGWARAAISQRNPGWAGALIAPRTNARLREAVRWDLHLVLPPVELAAIAADFLRREDHLANRLLAVHTGEWPDELALAVTETIARRARADRHSWQLAELCRAAALAMPPRYADAVARLADQLGAETADPSRVRPVAELASTLTFRHEMHQEFE